MADSFEEHSLMELNTSLCSESIKDLKQKYLKKAHSLSKKRKRKRVSHSFTHELSTDDSDYYNQVNKELKRLLLASVGSYDIQQHIVELVQRQTQLQYNLDVTMKHLTECTEEMDELSVEVDIWRSKVLASRLMIDELTLLKRQHTSDHHNSTNAIETLLKERSQLTNTILKCHTMLTSIGTVLHDNTYSNTSNHDGSQVATVRPVQLLPSNSTGCTVLELTSNMCTSIKMISDKINEVTKTTPTVKSTPKQLTSTEGEILGQKVLHHEPLATPLPVTSPHLSFGEQNLLQQRRRPHPSLINNETKDRHYCRKCIGSQLIII